MSDQRKGYEPGKDKPKKGYGKGDGPGRKVYGRDEDPAPTAYGEGEPPPTGQYGEKEPEPYGEEDAPVPAGYGEEAEPVPEDYETDEEEPTPEEYGGDKEPPPQDYGKPAPGGGESYKDPGDGEPCEPQDPLCDNDPKPSDRLRKLKVAKAHAETSKALEPILEAIALEEPAFVAKQKASAKAYLAATGEQDSPDNLRKRYANADAAFKDAMSYLRARRPGEHRTLLQEWVQCNLCDKGAPVRRVLNERRQVTRRLRNRKGPRELAVQDAHEATERWEAAWTSWSDPVANIAAILKSYEGRIGPLSDQFNDKPMADNAIFEFLFEVAPSHLGLRADPVGENEPGIKLVRALLGDFEDVQARLSNAKQRGRGGLYLTRNLAGERDYVLQEWEKAADAEAEARADYEMRPDDAAALEKRSATLKDDEWLERVRAALQAPAAA